MNYVTCRSDVVSPILCLCFLFASGIHFKIKIVTSISRAAIQENCALFDNFMEANCGKLWQTIANFGPEISSLVEFESLL